VQLQSWIQLLSSPAWLVVFQIQELLGLTVRWNDPGSQAGNWSNRLPNMALTRHNFPSLRSFEKQLVATGRHTRQNQPPESESRRLKTAA
jgi:hypothetical protein